MWASDPGIDIANEFAGLENHAQQFSPDDDCTESRGTIERRNKFHDPHKQADEFLSATEDERLRLREIADEQLRKTIARLAREFASRKPPRRSVPRIRRSPEAVRLAKLKTKNAYDERNRETIRLKAAAYNEKNKEAIAAKQRARNAAKRQAVQ